MTGEQRNEELAVLLNKFGRTCSSLHFETLVEPAYLQARDAILKEVGQLFAGQKRELDEEKIKFVIDLNVIFSQ